MDGSYVRRSACYVCPNEKDLQKQTFVKRDEFTPGFMVWAGVTFNDKTSLIFFDTGVRVNADYYIRS